MNASLLTVRLCWRTTSGSGGGRGGGSDGGCKGGKAGAWLAIGVMVGGRSWYSSAGSNGSKFSFVSTGGLGLRLRDSSKNKNKNDKKFAKFSVLIKLSQNDPDEVIESFAVSGWSIWTNSTPLYENIL